MSESSNYVLPQAWAYFINSLADVWSWYCHLTFREYPHEERCIKTWEKWVHLLNVSSYGQNYYKRSEGVVWVRATELQKRGCPHFHAVIGLVPLEVTRLDFKALWEDLAGFCKIQKYLSNRGAEYYMSKSAYAWKHGEIDVSANLPVNPLAF